MAAVARSTKLSAFARRWLSDPSTYPIIGVMGAAVTLYATMATHELRHPMAKFTAAERQRDAPDALASRQWTEHAVKQHSHARKQFGAKAEQQQTRVNVEILPSFNAVLRKVTGN